MTSVTIGHPKTSHKLSTARGHNVFQVHKVFHLGSCKSSKHYLFSETKKSESFLDPNIMK